MLIHFLEFLSGTLIGAAVFGWLNDKSYDKVNQDGWSSGFREGCEVGIRKAMNETSSIDNMVSNAMSHCSTTKYCTNCAYYNRETGICVFGEEPKYWEHDIVIKAIKKAAMISMEGL